MVIAPRIQQSGPEDTQTEDWAQKWNWTEGEARRREKDRSNPSCDINVTCYRPSHGSDLLEGNFCGSDHRGSSMSPPPRPPTSVDHENREGREAHCQGQRSLLLGWRRPGNQESDSSSSSSSSSSSQDHHEFRKYHRGPLHGCSRMSSTKPPPLYGYDDPPHYQPPARHRDGNFEFGKPFHHRIPPPPYYGFPPHALPHHYNHHGQPDRPPKPSHHYSHHGPARHPPKPPHHFNHHGPSHHYNHHGALHHHPRPPYHYDHHRLPHHGPPPPPSHHYNRHGPPYHPAPPPHRYGPERHRHPPPHHSRSGREDENEKHQDDQGHRGRHGCHKDPEKYRAPRYHAEQELFSIL